MNYLIFVTLLWSFSFSLIGVYLSGQVDPYISVFTRISLASLLFLPLLKPTSLPLKQVLALMLIGAIQLGGMYLFFYNSFLLLSVPEVLLFTVLTPVYITLLNDLIQKRFNPWFLVSAVLAVIGAVIIKYDNIRPNFIAGFFIVQGANFCFALGQVSYRHLYKNKPSVPQHQVFAWFYLGALIVTSFAMLTLADFNKMPNTPTQVGVLLWLGLLASGLGYFLWNKGACLVNSGTLAVMNNVLIPSGLAVNLLIWNHQANLAKLTLGGACMLLALYISQVKLIPLQPINKT